MSRMFLLGCVLAGCLSVPTAPTPACTVDSDCTDGPGEVCQEGVCWGDPPAGPFVAALGPPSVRTDLVSTELATLAIPPSGWMSGLQLDAPVTFSGRVEPFCPMPAMCDGTSIGATITITRPSLIPGKAPTVWNATSKDGIASGGDSFSVPVPRTQPGDPPYVVTIVPSGNGDLPPTDGSTSSAETSPPMRTTLTASDDVTRSTLTLGSNTSQVISGSLTDGSGHALTKYRVSAWGKWDAASPETEISTIDYTATGDFTITLADGIYGSIEIRAKPYDTNVVAPTLYLGSVPATSSQRTLAQPPLLGNKVAVTIPIEGVAGAGAVTPVSGATVIVTGTYAPQLTQGLGAILSVQTTTGDDGLAHLTLLDGTTLASTYLLQVVPPPSSNFGIIYNQPYTIDPTMTPVRLASRIALSGRVVDSSGNPLSGVSVTAQPSLRFKWSVDATALPFLTGIPAATAVTPATGDFVVWVDGLVDGVWGHYDLDFEPPTGAPAPSWLQPDIEIPRVLGQMSLAVSDVTIPDAANVHGNITDPGMAPVVGGILQIFQVVTDTSLCGEVAHPPDQCTIPAQLMGHGTSDDQGVVRLTLPRP